ncbi:LCP family protein [Streptococcus suis]|uniref:Regulatory protein MsrR n=1 Tax=Streptococcus suis TaxID=1307 RepID=A0A116LTY4_STRSU|nr:LCP family protein [Streptococcus suis]MCK3936865.1 LCP family protein [Streptococcus suis]NQH79444.1 LCP family protein [Streptococcus suis]CYV10881.1 transcriptional regulator [Streptococcus suis]HEL1655457.1 LCP family protein [Streptococcus suis]HEL1980476.1 LCP family protein [Streptococcus suis]
MNKNNNILTHHEQLRLDYLQKNIHYLNDKESRELDYLLYKKELRERHGSPRQSLRGFTPTAYADDFEEDYFEEDDEQEELLPRYPERKSRKTRQAKPQRFQSPRIEPKAKVPKPKKARKKGGFKRFIGFVLLAIALVIVAMGYNFFKGMNSVSEKPVAEVFNGVDTSNGTNILILGTDGRVGESSGETRTDTIMVLNVNNTDNKVKLVSFMRDTLVDIEGYEYKLNTAYTLGEQDNQQGAEEVRKVLKNNFDIDIKYYAMVDFATFATTIDTLFPEGVTIDAQFSTINGEVVSSVEVPNDLQLEENAPAYQTIQVGVQQMDGKTLLNYARYRSDDEGDFGRTRRQQEVLSAVMTQAKNPMKLFSGSEAIGKVVAMTPTTVPQSFMWLQGPGLLLDAANGIERVTIPEYGDWIDDYDMYGGMALRVDFEKYQQRLAELGLR